YLDASSPNVHAPQRTRAPHASHRATVRPGDASAPISSAGVRNIPTPIVCPTTRAVVDQKPSGRSRRVSPELGAFTGPGLKRAKRSLRRRAPGTPSPSRRDRSTSWRSSGTPTWGGRSHFLSEADHARTSESGKEELFVTGVLTRKRWPSLVTSQPNGPGGRGEKVL